jgi:Coenzyme PQQ synthesis protein D (PqqD)
VDEYRASRIKVLQLDQCTKLRGCEAVAITLDTTLSRNSDIFYAAVDSEEAVMLNVAAGKYYGLNAVAARIWELLERPMTLAQLCGRICEEFEVANQTCEAALLEFADEIIANGVVHASPA